MFEAVGKRSWGIYFNKLRECITDKGKIILQIITISEENYNYYANRKDFIQKYIFPGGMLPTKSLLKNLAKNNNLTFKNLPCGTNAPCRLIMDVLANKHPP